MVFYESKTKMMRYGVCTSFFQQRGEELARCAYHKACFVVSVTVDCVIMITFILCLRRVNVWL